MNTQTRRRADGWWYPWLYVVGMLVVIVVNGFLVYFALHSWTGLESPDYYSRGLHYNQNLEGARAQKALGWTVTSKVTPSRGSGGAPGNVRVDATYVGRDGKPLTDLSVKAYLRRPTSEGFDVSAPMTNDGGGRYTATLNVKLPGQWDLRLVALRKDAAHQQVRRIFLP